MRRSTGQQPGTESASRPSHKPLTNRPSTADFVPAFGLHRISLVRASGRTFRQYVLDDLEGTREACGLFPGRTVLSASRPDRPRPVAPPCAPSRPACGMFGFWNRQVAAQSPNQALSNPNPNIPRKFGSARRTTGRRGAAGSGRTERRRVGWPRSQPTL